MAIYTKDTFKLWLFNNVTKSFLFQPPFDNDRIRRQQGAMIFSSLLKVSPFEEFKKYKRLIKNKSFVNKMEKFTFVKDNVELRNMFSKKEFIIKAEDKSSLLRELDMVGINEAYVYPETEHQLRTIKYQSIPKDSLRIVID